MKQTQNYHLSQWEKTDRIKMEDFNSDNQKIDSQLHAAMQQLAQAASQEGLAAEQAAREAGDSAEADARTAGDNALRNENCWVKLKEVTVGAVNSVSISTADIDWNKYEQVELKIHMASSYSSCTMYMRFNGNDGSIYRTGVQGSNGIPVCSRGGESGFATVTLASSPAGKVMGYVLSTGLDGNVYWLAQPFAVPTLELNQVTSIQLYANGSSYLFSADSKVRLYGLKK